VRSHASAPPRPTSLHTHTASPGARPRHARPQPRHGKEDMWSPQSDFSDDSTLSQTQNVRPMDGWLTPHISPSRAGRHPCTRHRPQRHSAPGTAPLGCSVAVACTLFPETPRAAAAPRHSAAALPPGFPCLVLASRRSIWQGTHRSPARVGRWCVDLVPLLLVGCRRSWRRGDGSSRRAPHLTPRPRAPAPRPEPRVAHV